MTIINFDNIIGKKFNTITKQCFLFISSKKRVDNRTYFIWKNKHVDEFNSTKFYIRKNIYLY